MAGEMLADCIGTSSKQLVSLVAVPSRRQTIRPHRARAGERCERKATQDDVFFRARG